MTAHTENCIVCGSHIKYFESARSICCHICGTQHTTNTACLDGHYVCDSCHAEKGIICISNHASVALGKNPILIAIEMMENQSIYMHGPEHHCLVVAALLAAYRNAGGKADFTECLRNAVQRAKKVPGGICGIWGSCGAGIATGIFISVITGATPLSEKEWSLANRMTSGCLAIISENGGPRCCKRNTYLAIVQAAAFVREQFNVIMELPKQITCAFSHRNAQCKKAECLFYAL